MKSILFLFPILFGLHAAAQSAEGFCISGNCKNGFGKCKYLNPSAAIYEGNFVDGKWEGEGTLDVTGNFVYKGTFTNQTMTGTGTITYADGNKYTGQVVNGMLEGEGVFYFSSGILSVYKGSFRNSNLNGYGEATYADGAYKGDWVNGKRQGTGKQYDTDGKLLYDGPWEADSPTRPDQNSEYFLELKRAFSVPFYGLQYVTFHDVKGTVGVELTVYLASDFTVEGVSKVTIPIEDKTYIKKTGIKGNFDPKDNRLHIKHAYKYKEDWLPEGFTWVKLGQYNNFTMLKDNDHPGYYLLNGKDENQNVIELGNFKP